MTYRHDIDLLRALAVAAVVLFHLDPNWVPGGYVGVDVFFVISGYLITQQIILRLESGTFLVKDFYVRRLRRLLPATLATVVLSGMGALFLLSGEARTDHYAASLFCTSALGNVYFAKTTDYFDPSTLEKPLLHLWSLGVEEQFYLAWPALLLLLWRLPTTPNKRLWTLRLVFGALVLVSFSATQTLLTTRPQEVFYLPHLRAWEFALGGLIPLLPAHSARRRLSYPFYLTGTAAIFAAMFWLDQETAFPGLAASLPCLGTCLAIYAKPPPLEGSSRFLRPALGLGRISYSVYLVHWPLIVFVFAWRGESTLLAKLGILVATILLGAIMWRFIEQPFRLTDGRKDSHGFLLTVLASVSLLGVTSGTLWANPVKNATPESELTNSRISWLQKETAWASLIRSNQPCMVDGSEFDASVCLRARAPGDTRPRVLVYGDSLAESLHAGMSVHWAGRVHLDLAASPGCRPIIKPKKHTVGCISLNAAIFETADLSPYDLVVIHSRFDNVKPFEIGQTIEGLRDRGARHVVVVGSAIVYRSSVAGLLEKHLSAPFLEQHRALTDQVDLEIFAKDQQIGKAVRANQAHFISLLNLLCPQHTPSSCSHFMGETGDALVMDHVHYSRYGGAWLLGLIEQARAGGKHWPKTFRKE